MGLFSLAENCFKKSNDYSSLFLFYSSYGDEEGLKYVMTKAQNDGKFNIAYEAAFLLGQPESCINILMKSKRHAEAAMFARAYCPNLIKEIMKEWSDILK